jgi:hypothetical protein
MNGISFLKAVRLLTGKSREEVAIEELNSGADYYLQRGGDPNLFAELSLQVQQAVCKAF